MGGGALIKELEETGDHHESHGSEGSSEDNDEDYEDQDSQEVDLDPIQEDKVEEEPVETKKKKKKNAGFNLNEIDEMLNKGTISKENPSESKEIKEGGDQPEQEMLLGILSGVQKNQNGKKKKRNRKKDDTEEEEEDEN